MKRYIIAAILGFSSVAVLGAQAANISSYSQQVFAPGVNPVTGSPQWTNTYQATSAVCNQVAPTVPGTVTNPTRFFFDDAANPGKVCIVPIASALLIALPNGVGYVSTLTQTDTLSQVSPRSAASNPFNMQGLPPVLTGFKIVQ